MDGTMVYLMNPPMLTFGLLPRGFAIINRAEMSITRVVFLTCWTGCAQTPSRNVERSLGTVITVGMHGFLPVLSVGPLGCSVGPLGYSHICLVL